MAPSIPSGHWVERRSPRQNVALTLFCLLFVSGCWFAGYSVGKLQPEWKPVQTMMAPAPLVEDSDVTRKGYWYSWYYNDQGELLYKRGGKSTVKLLIRYSNGTTEDL